jgi:hypothetical protein
LSILADVFREKLKRGKVKTKRGNVENGITHKRLANIKQKMLKE